MSQLRKMKNSKNTDPLALAATIGITAQTTSQRIFNEVAAAANLFSRPAQPRPAQEIKELMAFVRLLEDRPTDLPDLSETLRLLLGITEDYEADELLSDRFALYDRARSVLSALKDSEVVAMDRKGGRRRDPRLDRFAIALTQIYAKYTDMPITFSIAPDSGQLTSPFSLFFYEAICQFFPRARYQEGTLRGALEAAAAGIKNIEEMTPEELDDLFK